MKPNRLSFVLTGLVMAFCLSTSLNFLEAADAPGTAAPSPVAPSLTAAAPTKTAHAKKKKPKKARKLRPVHSPVVTKP